MSNNINNNMVTLESLEKIASNSLYGFGASSSSVKYLDVILKQVRYLNLVRQREL
jgi:hypothetical protein